MSIISQDRSMIPVRDYVNVKCPCGRALRAKLDQAGGTITCWSCHAAVNVPVPVAPGDWVARLLRMGARQILEARTFTLLAVGAALVTLSLSITHLGLPARLLARVSTPGIYFAGIAMTLVMIGYGELLRRGSQGDWTARPHVGWWARAWRALICLSAGSALVLPLIYAAETGTIPRATAQGLSIALGVTVLMPLVMLGTYAPRGSVLGRVAMISSMLRRHPFAVLASLLVLPFSLVVIEGLAFVLTRITQDFAFMIFDLFPNRPEVSNFGHVPYFTDVDQKLTDYRVMADSRIMGFYGDHLRHGYGLIGVIPASLALPTSNGYDSFTSLQISPRAYLVHRMGYTLFIVTCILALMAIQARWLGLISTMDSRKTEAHPGSTGLPALPNPAEN
jgi:hypothetical protein